MKRVYLVDASVVIRMLRGDHSEHSPQATALFKRAESREFTLEITDVTAAEIVWVLTSFYRVPRQDIAHALLNLLGNPGVAASNGPWLLAALESFRDTNVDATDCFLAAFARNAEKPVVSFDRDYRKFPGLKWFTPDKVAKQSATP